MAETVGAPIVKALLGKAAVSDFSPYTTGGIGLIGTKPSQDVMEDCDTLFLIGTSFPYMEFLPKPFGEYKHKFSFGNSFQRFKNFLKQFSYG